MAVIPRKGCQQPGDTPWPRANEERAPSASSASASWAVHSPEISWRQAGASSAMTSMRGGGARWRGPASRSRAMPPAVAAAAPVIITSLPNPQALHDTVAAIAAAKLPPARHRRSEHLHAGRQARRRTRAQARGTYRARLPGQRHRRASARPRISSSMPAATPRRSRKLRRAVRWASRAPSMTSAHSATAAG